MTAARGVAAAPVVRRAVVVAIEPGDVPVLP